ncbi:restriction endonuclease subunit S [Vibrio sp. WXL103]|uniref:restriction endonuclease subunit S n=1 Tax=Vibrio sp. WXL103 TaxID=3450710 RepID=UPI003EC4F9D7
MVPNGWKVARLEDIASRAKYSMVDGPFGSNLKSEHYREVGVPVLQSGFVTSGWFKAKNYVYVEQQLFEEQKRSSAKAGDILMAKIGAQAGRCGIIPDGHPVSIIAGNCLKLSFDDEITSTHYMHTALSWEYERTGLVEIKTETAQPAISLKSLKSFRMVLPPLSEQRKIAKILSTWDKAITTTEKLIDTSKQQKKALMQQLLTGKKRLVNPETGKAFEGEWEEVHLKDICEVNPKKPKEPESGLVSFVPMDAVSEDAKLLRTDEKPYSEVSKGFTSFKDLDTLIAKITPCFENGKGALVNHLENGIGFGSTEFHVLRAKQGNAPDFVYYLTTTSSFRVKGEMNMQGSAGQKRVTTDYLKLYKVVVPKELNEQQKIASVLTAADKEIEILEAKLSHFKQEKKALMQQLLTGKRRVKVDEMEVA